MGLFSLRLLAYGHFQENSFIIRNLQICEKIFQIFDLYIYTYTHKDAHTYTHI